MSPQPQIEGIRAVDFCNFTFLYFDIYAKVTFNLRLKNGTRTLLRDKSGEILERTNNLGADLQDVVYGQIEGLGETAICVIEIDAGGTMVTDVVYIHKIENGKPKLVWHWESGDRSDGGLRRLYIKGGNLVVETYEELADEPLCCATHFEKHYYHWKHGKIREFRQETELPIGGPLSAAVYLGKN